MGLCQMKYAEVEHKSDMDVDRDVNDNNYMDVDRDVNDNNYNNNNKIEDGSQQRQQIMMNLYPVHYNINIIILSVPIGIILICNRYIRII
eukprot:156172_1